MIPTTVGAAAVPAEAAEGTSSLWTPESERLPAAGSGEAKPESKLWIPGMD
jgi:hypothetical protein